MCESCDEAFSEPQEAWVPKMPDQLRMRFNCGLTLTTQAASWQFRPCRFGFRYLRRDMDDSGNISPNRQWTLGFVWVERTPWEWFF